MTYVLCADIHAHSWSAFSKVDQDGVNSRLNLILSELRRAGDVALQTDSRKLLIDGDLFHTRGNVAPSVMNPLFDLVVELTRQGVKVVIMAGNHDLETKEATRLSSAVTHLQGAGACIINGPSQFHADILCAFVPWFESVTELKAYLEDLHPPGIGKPGVGRSAWDLHLHAPINGVIMGIPDHGLEPAWLASLGWKRVFSGHYHEHKVFEEGKVVSIGAIGHHTWNDVGTTAGFLEVSEGSFTHRESRMPKFVDLVQGADINAIVPGNYVRAKLSSAKMDDVSQMREGLLKLGALGVNIITIKQPVEQREGAPLVTAHSRTLQQSVTEYVTANGRFEHAAEVATEALKCLAEANAE